MAKPIAPKKGIAFAFPDVCKTPSASGSIPLPYPNIAQLSDAKLVTVTLLVGGYPVLLIDSVVDTSSGDEAGSVGGVKSGKTGGALTITKASATVLYGPEKKGIVRFMDPTTQNDKNASGFILSSFPTVLVGD
jgi:hypothetical protein